MLSKIREGLSAAGQSLAGDGMLLRLRNASIALVGAVTAVGLGLTLFISQLGFPAVFSGPIPGGPSEAGSVRNAIALSQDPDVGSSSSASPALSAGSVALAPAHPRRSSQGGNGDGSRGGSDQIAVSPGAQSGPAALQPPKADPVSAPPASPVVPSPSVPSPPPAPTAVADLPQSSPAGQQKGVSDGKLKPSGPSTAKVTSDGKGKPETSTSGKDQPGGKSGDKTASGTKSSGTSAEKVSKDQSTASAPKPVASDPSASPAPEAASPAAAKEAADSGK